VRRESAKHAAYREELVSARVAVFDRCHGVCERCRNAPVRVIHHKLRRSQGGTNALENLAGLCSGCHDEVHAHPERAYSDGWLTRGTAGDRMGTDGTVQRHPA
jgi:5-methylcytosine-specific restriction endonuclease McrA